MGFLVLPLTAYACQCMDYAAGISEKASTSDYILRGIYIGDRKFIVRDILKGDFQENTVINVKSISDYCKPVFQEDQGYILFIKKKWWCTGNRFLQFLIFGSPILGKQSSC